ncbi:hypothetical protein BIV23_27105 [Streptomyces monashensis]|uniref:Uncharacterized protein n=1 Tax=Streptomyces monashensis TaxID=1678012 RepID=A0A1S2Q277_9ACTN|nr:hypothetical protein BIV23_27105 [Streptomyces monashensis]
MCCFLSERTALRLSVPAREFFEGVQGGGFLRGVLDDQADLRMRRTLRYPRQRGERTEPLAVSDLQA